MGPEHSPQSVPEGEADRRSPTRREMLAAATALMASAAASSPAQAGIGAEGYFLTFEATGAPNADRLFFIPSAWLELFEVTDIYKANYTAAQWNLTLVRMRSGMPHARRRRINALYTDSTDPGVLEPFPGSTVIPPVPPGANQTYLAAMIAPGDIPA